MSKDKSRQVTSTRSIRTAACAADFMNYYAKSTYAQRRASDNPPRFDFVTGNPFEFPLSGLVSALSKNTQPRANTWFGYQMSETPSCEIVAASLEKRLGIAFDPADVVMTSGGFAAIMIALKVVADPGDEIVVNTPWWFLYPTILEAASVQPVKVPLRQDFSLDLEGIRNAITPKTRAILLNSPHNPSGRLVRAEEAAEIAKILTAASQAQGRPVYLISDEAFSRIVYDGKKFESPVAAYPHSMLLYTYGKILLAPGERIGFLAVPKSMPEEDRIALRDPLMHLTIGSGWVFPNATLQRSLAEIDQIGIDIAHLQGNRDVFRNELTKAGYQVNTPEGTFFMLVKSPLSDDLAFAEILAQHDIFVTPGSMCAAPGWLRVSLCAKRDTVVDSLAGWTRAIRQVA